MADAELPGIEALLSHSEWMRALARSLVGDAQSDDVLQEVWVAALTRGPARAINVRGWLATVLRNAARRQRRAENRRREREALLAPGEAQPSTLEVVERFSTHQVVAAEVLALPEQARDRLLLRFYEGLSLRELAAREGVSIATVRERLSHSLALLRRRLETRLDARGERFTLALAPFLSRPGSAAATVTFPLAAKVALVAGAVGLAFLLQAALASHRVDDVERVAQAPLVASARPMADADAEPEELFLPERRILAVPPLSPATSTKASAPAALVVQVVDNGGAPFAEPVTITAQPAPGASALGAAITARTDARGFAHFDDLPPGDWSVHSDRGGSSRLTLRADERAQHELALPAGPPLEGIVVDAVGQPVPDAYVWLSPSTAETWTTDAAVRSWVDADAAIRTDHGGRFRFASIGRARVLGARSAGHAPSPDIELLGDAAPSLLTIELPGPGSTLTGRVLGPAGAPVSAALVYLDAAGDATGTSSATKRSHLVRTQADDHGAFHFASVASGERRLTVLAPGFAPWRERVGVAAGEPLELALTLERGTTIRGRVTDEGGRAMAGASVFASRRAWSYLPDGRFGAATSTDVDGRYRLTGIEPRAVWLVVEGGDGRRYEELVRGAADAELTRDVTLPSTTTLRGRVVDEQGRGIHPCVVFVAPDGDAKARPVETDARGRFTARVASDGAHVAWIEEGGTLLDFEQTIASTAEEVTLRLADAVRPNVTLIGSLRQATDEPLRVPAVRFRGANGLERELALVVEADGRFRSAPLVPGTYELAFALPDRPELRLPPIELRAHASHDVGELVFAPACAVELDFARAGGEPLERLRVEIEDAQGAVVFARNVPRAALPLAPKLAAGRYTVRAWGPTLLPTERPLEARLDTPLRVALVLSSGLPRVLEVHTPRGTPGGLTVRLELRDAAGALLFRTRLRGQRRVELGLAPGPVHARAVAPGLGDATRTWTVPSAADAQDTDHPLVISIVPH